MSIEVPYSLGLGRDEAAAAAVPGTTVEPESGRMKIFLGAAVPPDKRSSYINSLRACWHRLKNDLALDSGDTVVAHGRWNSATSGSVIVGTDTAGVGDDSVAVIVAADFMVDKGASHFTDECFSRLLTALQERTKDN